MRGKLPVHPAFLDVYSHRAARREVHKGIERVLSPSDTVKSASAVKEGTIDPSGPRYGRPSHRFGPPTALFSEPLALLKYNLEHLESFTPDLATLNCALNLITSSTDFFPDGDQRAEVLKVILGDLIPGRKLWQRPTTRKTAQPDGVWLEDFFAYIIVELKNEPGLAGDPFLQALIAYGKLIAEDEVLSGPTQRLRSTDSYRSTPHTSIGPFYLPFFWPSQGTVSSYLDRKSVV